MPSDRHWRHVVRSSLAIIFTTVFVDLLGFGIVLPLLPYYAQQLHASGVTAGALIAVYSAMQFMAAPWWGRLSDRIGRRPLLLAGLKTGSRQARRACWPALPAPQASQRSASRAASTRRSPFDVDRRIAT